MADIQISWLCFPFTCNPSRAQPPLLAKGNLNRMRHNATASVATDLNCSRELAAMAANVALWTDALSTLSAGVHNARTDRWYPARF